MLVVYKSPRTQRYEQLAGYGLGVAIALLFKRYAAAEPILATIGFCFTFFAVPLINTWRLKLGGHLLPLAEVTKRQAEAMAARSPLIGALYQAVWFTGIVGAVILFSDSKPLAESIASHLAEPWILVMLPVAGFAGGYFQTRKFRARAKAQLENPAASLGFKLPGLRVVFMSIAVLIALAGITGSTMIWINGTPEGFRFLPVGPWAMLPAICGIASALVIYFANRIVRQTKPQLQASPHLKTIIATGIAYWGVPMACFGILMCSYFDVLRDCGQHRCEASQIIAAFGQFVPLIAALGILGGIGFGLILGLVFKAYALLGTKAP